METHQGPRPVYGGPGRIGLIGMAPQGNRAGGPGVPWTPGRRPPHRNGGARRLSGYAAKSRSDAPTGGALSEPVPLFPAAVQAAIAKGLGPCLSSTRSRKNNDESRCCAKDGRKANLATNLQDKPHQRPIKEKYNVRGAEWGGAKAPKIVPQPSQTSKNPPFWWF